MGKNDASLFDADNTDNDNNDGVGNEETVDYLAEFVGEGKKYKSVEDLAKAYHHSTRFADQLKTE